MQFLHDVHGGHHDHEHHKHDHHDHDHKHDHHDHDHHKHDHHDHDDHDIKHRNTKKLRHDSGVGSVGLQVEGELDIVELNQWLGTFLSTRGDDIYRSKGVLKFKDQGDVKFVFQGVHEQINFGPSAARWYVELVSPTTDVSMSESSGEESNGDY